MTLAQARALAATIVVVSLVCTAGCGAGSRSRKSGDGLGAGFQAPPAPPKGTLTPLTPDPEPLRLERPAAAAVAPAAPPVAAPRLPAHGEVVVVDVPAEILTRVAPSHSDPARVAGIAGTVVVDALVDERGRVVDTYIAKSIRELDSASVAAVKKYTFRPATRQGKPVATWVSVPVKYTFGGTNPN